MTAQSWRVCVEHREDGRRFQGFGAVVGVGTAPGAGGVSLPLRGVAPRHLRLVPCEGGVVVHPGEAAVHRRPTSVPATTPFLLPVGGELWLSSGGRAVGLRLVEVAALQAGSVPLERAPAAQRARGWSLVLVGLAVALGAVLVGASRHAERLPSLASQLWQPAPALQVDLDRAWRTFVDAPSIQLGAQADPAATLRAAVSAELSRLARQPAWLKRLDEIRPEWRRVLQTLRDAELPDALAAIPLVESCYRADPVSPCCARGWWQFMPEEGARLREDGLLGALGDVRGCARRSGGAPFTPTAQAPPPMSCARGPYVLDGACDLSTCAVDFRSDLELSTRAAVRRFDEVREDPALLASGVLVPAMIASHHAGYDDARLLGPRGPAKPYNLRPAHERWAASSSPRPFAEDAFGCFAQPEAPSCERYLIAQTQRYVARVLALHLLAVCRYGQTAGHDPVFAPYARLSTPDRCFGVDLPVPDAVSRASSAVVCPP